MKALKRTEFTLKRDDVVQIIRRHFGSEYDLRDDIQTPADLALIAVRFYGELGLPESCVTVSWEQEVTP